jgi:hypothetical protein
MKNLLKWLFGTQKQQLDIPVVSGSVLCEACRQDEGIKVNVLNGDYTKERHLCKECIRVNCECGRFVEIL